MAFPIVSVPGSKLGGVFVYKSEYNISFPFFVLILVSVNSE